MAKNTVLTLKKKVDEGGKVTMVTSYDYTMAALVEEAGIDMILVGDSLGMTMMGYDSTIPVTMDDMVHHTRCVTRATSNTFVVGDMPFLSYEQDVATAVSNAGRLMKEGRCQAVKLEGGIEVCPQVKAMVEAGIPVVGHIGLTPQSVNAFGGFKPKMVRQFAQVGEAIKQAYHDYDAAVQDGSFPAAAESYKDIDPELMEEVKRA